MNNKERNIIARFLADIEGDPDIIASVDPLLEKLKDEKLKALFDSEVLLDQEYESDIEKIKELAIDLWSKDFPNEFRQNWCMSRSYKTKDYWGMAKKIIEDEEA